MSLYIECSECGNQCVVSCVMISYADQGLEFFADCNCRSDSPNVHWALPKIVFRNFIFTLLVHNVHSRIYSMERGFETYGLNLIGKFYDDMCDEDCSMTLDSLKEAIDDFKSGQ